MLEHQKNIVDELTLCIININNASSNYSAIMNVEYQKLINVILRKKAHNDILYQNLYVSVYVTS